jgi:thioredoxin-related protein
MGCVLAEPIVNGIETELNDQLIVLRVDIQSPAGQELSDQYAARATPTFIFFDPSGVELWRSIGQLDPEQVRASLD